MTTRRLAAILAADVAGFSAMMERDEEGTAARIKTLRAEVIEPALARHQGRLVKTTGDGFLAKFASPVEAVRSAIAIHEQLASGDLKPIGSTNNSPSIQVHAVRGNRPVPRDDKHLDQRRATDCTSRLAS